MLTGARGVSVTRVHEICPDCGAGLDADPRFVIWCAACEWNLARDEVPVPSRQVAREEALLARLRESGDAPRLGIAGVAALALAVTVVLVPVVLAATGAWLVAGSWPNAFGVAAGCVLLVFAYALRPRAGRANQPSA